MDVTSMLNSGSSIAAAGQSKDTVTTKLPNRNRTPWDAGGYALPIITHTPSRQYLEERQDSEFIRTTQEVSPKSWQHVTSRTSIEYDRYIQPNTPESLDEAVGQSQDEVVHTDGSMDMVRHQQNDSSNVPHHYLSDSRSSLSSFTSSPCLSSATHSRFSSMSTVGGCQPLSTITDDADVDEKARHLRSQNGIRLPLLLSPDAGHPRMQSLSSTTEPLSTLALIAERRSQEDLLDSSDEQTARRLHHQSHLNDQNKAPKYDFRSASPSDAVLIKRLACQDLPEPSPFHDRKRRLYDPNQSVSVQKDSSPRRLSLPKSIHQRTISAPDFPSHPAEAHRAVYTGSTFLVPGSEPTPPCSSHPDYDSPSPSHPNTTPNTPPELPPLLKATTEPRCMYIEDCDTNSTPRKAISHLLGRNKMCTRLIPAHIWVQYCRKHYQRARYRNMSGWPPLQCELVQEQIKRLDIWSNDNATKGSGPLVKDWTLALRKREQTRRERLAQATKSEGRGDSDDEASRIHGGSDRNDNPPQAVPDWLFDMVGSGYSSAEIENVFQRIHSAILAKELPNMPDIEILPNIVVDRDTAMAATTTETLGYVKRKPSASAVAHVRSRSLGRAAFGWGGVARQAGGWERSAQISISMSPSSATKRKRFDELEEERFVASASAAVVNNQHVRLVPNDPFGRQQRLRYQQQQQTQQQQQSHPQHLLYPRHVTEAQAYGGDEIFFRNGSGYRPQQGNSYGYAQSHSHSHSHGYSHSHSQVQVLPPYPTPSPIMAPQPLRATMMPTARTLQLDIEGGIGVGAGMNPRQQLVHQRSRSDASFHRIDFDGSGNGFGGVAGYGPSQSLGFHAEGREMEGPSWSDGGEGGEGVGFRR